MKSYHLSFLIGIVSLSLYSCGKKTNKDLAIALVASKYEKSDQGLNFDSAKLDSLYNISPQDYADSLKKGDELDVTLAELESQIEHLGQAESDSVGLISVKLTKERYRLLELKKIKPEFIGWKLSGVSVAGDKQKALSFNFDKEITKIVP